MTARTAVITGASGQDGSLLSEALAAEGYRVVGIVRERSTVSVPNAPVAEALRAVDLTSVIAVQQLLDEVQPDELYHLAAAHHSSQAGADGVSRHDMLATNFLATKSLAEGVLAVRPQCSLVFAASSQMYAAAGAVAVIDEGSVRRPATFYGHTKSWSLELLGFLRERAGLRASTAILFNHESIRRDASFVSRKITQAVARINRGEICTLELQNVGARADWSSAHDVVDALRLMGRAPTPRDYVIGSGQLNTVRDMAHAAFERAGLDWRSHTRFARDEALPALVSRPDRILHCLGWVPKRPFADWIVDMVDQELALSSP
jgi:GDPmannose 4,6-dehydratase